MPVKDEGIERLARTVLSRGHGLSVSLSVGDSTSWAAPRRWDCDVGTCNERRPTGPALDSHPCAPRRTSTVHRLSASRRIGVRPTRERSHEKPGCPRHRRGEDPHGPSRATPSSVRIACCELCEGCHARTCPPSRGVRQEAEVLCGSSLGHTSSCLYTPGGLQKLSHGGAPGGMDEEDPRSRGVRYHCGTWPRE